MPTQLRLNTTRATLERVFEVALRAAQGGRRLAREGSIEAGALRLPSLGLRVELPDPSRGGRVFVLGAGKAAGHLAAALEEVIGSSITDGVVIVKRGHGVPLRHCRMFEAGHPLPDEAGVAATRELLAVAERARTGDLVLVVITGGASSLLVAPAAGLSLDDKRRTTDALLRSGASIDEINCVRKHLSAIKGGHLARVLRRARVCTLAVSDVLGDDLSSIGSGVTVADPTTYADALGVLERYGLGAPDVPGAVLAHLQRGVRGELRETPKPGELAASDYGLLASNRLAIEAALDAARRRGLHAVHVTDRMQGDTERAAREFAALARRMQQERGRAEAPALLVAGGETTVRVLGPGLGGRNQHFALVAAEALHGVPGIVLLAAGTDGTDGPTDAAGAFADGRTWSRAQALGVDPAACLAAFDSHRVFRALGDLYAPGPTGTNVMDLALALVQPGAGNSRW